MGVIAATIVNANPFRGKSAQPVSPRDFLLGFDPDKGQRAKAAGPHRPAITDPGQMMAIARAMAGGKVDTFPRGTLSTKERERRERESRYGDDR